MSIKVIVSTILIAVCLITHSQSASCKGRVIFPDDVLDIAVHGQPDLSVVTRVSSDGKISFPLLGILNVAGKTARELEKEMEELLDKDYIVNPDVVVLTTDYHIDNIYIMGEVENPQAINLNRNKATTILEAISMAGGFTNIANKNKIQIMRTVADGTKKIMIVKLYNILRNKQNGKEEGDAKTALQPGDIIIVAERKF